MQYEIAKEFWKNVHIQKMTAAFLLRCQNSLRWEICLISHWNVDSWRQKLSFGYLMNPKNNKKIIKIQHRLLLVRAITIRGVLLVKIRKIFLKMYLFRDVSPKWVLTLQKEISCHIFKMGTFSKFFDDFMRHIIR